MTRFLIILFAFATDLTAATWYVDSAATGSRDGTSWANAWTNLDASKPVAAGGDTVYISGGTTTRTYLTPYFKTTAGTSASRITYRIGQDSGHNGTAIFDGQGTRTAFLYDAQNIVFSGNYNGEQHFVITNDLSSGWSVWCDAGTNITLEYVKCYNSTRFNGSANIELSHCYFEPPFASDIAVNDYAISWGVGQAYGTDLSYTNNSIHNCIIVMKSCDTDPALGGDGIQGGQCSSVYSNLFMVQYVANLTSSQHSDGWQNLAGSNCRIWANTFENIANYGIYWEMTSVCSNVLVFNNVFRHNSTLAHASTYSVGAIIAAQGIKDRIFTNLCIINNTFVDYFGRSAFSGGDNAGPNTNTYLNCRMQNNLMMNSGNGQSEAFSCVNTNQWIITHNRAISGSRGTNAGPVQTMLPGGDAGLHFVSYAERSVDNNLRLASNDTAAIGAGTNLTALALFTVDADGYSRPASSAWTLGSYEATGAEPGPLPPVFTPSQTNFTSFSQNIEISCNDSNTIAYWTNGTIHSISQPVTITVGNGFILRAFATNVATSTGSAITIASYSQTNSVIPLTNSFSVRAMRVGR